jgi:hypothetical protein
MTALFGAKMKGCARVQELKHHTADIAWLDAEDARRAWDVVRLHATWLLSSRLRNKQGIAGKRSQR